VEGSHGGEFRLTGGIGFVMPRETKALIGPK
jgi:hypothetical protein